MGYYQGPETIVNTQTTNATATTIATIAIPDNSVACFNIQVAGVNAANNGQSCFFHFELRVTRSGGGNSVLGSITTLISDKTAGITWTAAASVSGTNLLVKVTGALLTTVNWAASIEELVLP